MQGLFTSRGTLLRSLALILKDFLTFRGYYFLGFLLSGVFTLRGSYIQGS